MGWDFAKTKVYKERSGKLLASEAELKKKITCTDKETHQTICRKNEICRRKTRKVYQNAVWLMLFWLMYF